MNAWDIGKFAEEIFQGGPHRVSDLVTGLVLGFSACWLLRRHNEGPLQTANSSLNVKNEELKSDRDLLQSELDALHDDQLNRLHSELDKRSVPRGKREISAWTRGGRRLPVCIQNRGEKNHRVVFPDGKDDTVAIEELSPWP